MSSPVFSRALKPSWEPLGYQQTKWGKRYWLRIGDAVRAYRASEMWGVSFLADIYPDMEYWRRQFPYGVGRRIDTGRACTFFTTACLNAGEYNPPVASQ